MTADPVIAIAAAVAAATAAADVAVVVVVAADWFDRGGGGIGGVNGHGHGLARLEGDGKTSEGLARLDNTDRPPGLLRDSSSSGVPASPTLPRLSSEWSSSASPSASPSPSPPSPMYLTHFFLRLQITTGNRLVRARLGVLKTRRNVVVFRLLQFPSVRDNLFKQHVNIANFLFIFILATS